MISVGVIRCEKLANYFFVLLFLYFQLANSFFVILSMKARAVDYFFIVTFHNQVWAIVIFIYYEFKLKL